MQLSIYERLFEYYQEILPRFYGETVHITNLTGKQVLLNPDRNDYVLLRDKERMVDASLRSFHGQAFSSRGISGSYPVDGFLYSDLENLERLPLFVATLNAMLRALGLIEHTVHCTDDGPSVCARHMIEKTLYEHENIGRLGIVGYQKAIIAQASKQFKGTIRVTDLASANIGECIKEGNIIVEDGASMTKDLIRWADVLLITGSTLVNRTIEEFIDIKIPHYFYGNTIAGAAYICELPRMCFEAT